MVSKEWCARSGDQVSPSRNRWGLVSVGRWAGGLPPAIPIQPGVWLNRSRFTRWVRKSGLPGRSPSPIAGGRVPGLSPGGRLQETKGRERRSP